MKTTREIWINKVVAVSKHNVAILHADYSKSLIGPAIICECRECGLSFRNEHAPLLGMEYVKCPHCSRKHSAYVDVMDSDIFQDLAF